MAVPESERRYRRHEVRTDCYVTTEGGRPLGDRCLDLSYDGVQVERQGDARLGERVSVTLRLPGTGVWVDAKGYVARVSQGRRTEDRARTLGIHLTNMNGMDRVVIASMLPAYPRPRPARGGGHRDYATIVRRISEHP